MKRALSLLLVLVMVVSMIPSVFATTDEKPEVEMDELTLGLEINPQAAELDTLYTTVRDAHYYTITPAEDGKLLLTVDANGTVAVQDVELSDGNFDVVAGTTYTVVVTKTGDANPTWSATYIAPHVHAAATYTDNGDGTHKVICECGEVVTASVAHNFVEGTCVCGAVETPACEYVDADQDGKCDTCGEANLDETGLLTFYDLGINLSADIRGVPQVRRMKDGTNPYESFKVFAEVYSKGVEEELEVANVLDKSKHITYVYAVAVPAKELADIMKLRIVGITAEGEAFTSSVTTWSIKQGLVDAMDTYAAQTGEAYANRVKLCANILNYGAEAQKKFEYETNNLATAGLKDEYAALIIKDTPAMEEIPTTDDTGAYATLKVIDFNLAARVQVVPRFVVPAADAKEDYKAVITKVHIAPDGTETTSSFTVEGDSIRKTAGKTALYVVIDTLASKELRDVMTITLYKGDTAVSVAQNFSGESALLPKMTSIPALGAALMNYCDCARACFG